MTDDDKRILRQAAAIVQQVNAGQKPGEHRPDDLVRARLLKLAGPE